MLDTHTFMLVLGLLRPWTRTLALIRRQKGLNNLVAPKTLVAIPARNEADCIGDCLHALDQQSRRPDTVIVLLNNCDDQSEAVVAANVPNLRFRVDVSSIVLPPDENGAGFARRRAMAMAASLATAGDTLLTTDADAVAPPDWIDRNLKALAAGADVVCGRTVMNPLDAIEIPRHVHERHEMETRYIDLLDDLAWLLDPEPSDPQPRHSEASGATLAVTLSAFERVGGFPDLASGEDRAFVRSLWKLDARIRHDPDVQVIVSGRTLGRAHNGMADTLRRRLNRTDELADEQAEPAKNALQRYRLRRNFRALWKRQTDSGMAPLLGPSDNDFRQILRIRHFGESWMAIEKACTCLARHRVHSGDIADEIILAEMLRDEALRSISIES